MATAMEESFGVGVETGDMVMSASLMTTSLPCTPLEEERPSSSLSTASRSSKSSRIPRLTRSASMRVKSSASSSSPSTPDASTSSSSSSRAVSSTLSSSTRGIVRSASFVSSRGMSSLTSPPSASSSSYHHHSNSTPSPSTHFSRSHTLTPETPRKYSHHSSTYSRRSNSGASERKTHSLPHTPSPPLMYVSIVEHSVEAPAQDPRGTRDFAPTKDTHQERFRSSSYSCSSASSSSSASFDISKTSTSAFATATTNFTNNTIQPIPKNHNHLSYAGLGTPPWYPGGTGHSYNIHHRRPNHLPVSSSFSSSTAYHGPSLHHPAGATSASQPHTPGSRSPDSEGGIDDADSVKSFGSVSSAVSCDAALTRHHPHGGSCGSGPGGRSLKYVLHCRHNHEQDPDTYLTPTQRAARRIRELKSLLAEARREVNTRDAEIARLTRELVELRLLKARSQHQDDEMQANTEDNAKTTDIATTTTLPNTGVQDQVRDNRRQATTSIGTPSTPTPKTSSTPSEGSEPELSRLMDNLTTDAGAPRLPVASPAAGSVAETTSDSADLTRSLADSGHYEDLTSPSLSSRDPFEASRGSLRGRQIDEDEDEDVDRWAALEEMETRMREEYHQREDQLKRNHMDEYHELKEKHNDRVEALLSKLSDANLKYFELRPQYDRSQERIRELEREIVKVKDELTEAELRHQKMYLQMFLKGQQAAKLQADDEQDAEIESQSSVSSGGPMVDLMKQLSRTEEELEKMKALYRREIACRSNNNNNNNNNSTRNGELDPEVTLQFLKSAIYYFLTDKDNSRGHLRAIESILGYTDTERYNIQKVVK